MRIPEKIRYAYEIQEKYPADLDAPMGYNEIMRTKESVFVPQISEEMIAQSAIDEHHFSLVMSLGLKSFISVPIISQNEALGVMTFVTAESGRIYTEEDIPYLENIARKLGLLLRAHRANERAEQALMDREEAQRSLRESEELLQSIFDYASDHIFTVDRSGTIFFINHVAPGLQREDVLGKCLFDFQSEENRSRVEDAVKQVFDTGEPSYYETDIKIGEQQISYSSTVSPLKNDQGIYAATIISRDITIQKQLQNNLEENNELLEKTVNERTHELQSANNELSAFAYSVSHDLRAPLRAMVGYSQIIMEDYEEEISEDALDCVQIINDEAKRMGLLIDDLLEFSRMQRKEASMAEFSMKDLVMQVYKEYKLNHPQAIFEFECKKLPRVTGDASMFRHVWSNLLSNAVKYSREDHTNHIQIKYQEKEEEFIFSISDQGVGFDMKYYNKLFGVFQRLHSEDEFEGTGIGLALVKKIVTRHKGNIWAESVLNEGSTFYFTIPKISKT